MPYKGIDPAALDQEVTVPLTMRDVALIRTGLEELLRIYTREEHLYHDIHAALAKLPAPERREAAPASGAG